MSKALQTVPTGDAELTKLQGFFLQNGEKNTLIPHADNVNITNNYNSQRNNESVIFLPYIRNERFVGRVALLEWIHSEFTKDSSNSPVVATICGLSGIGKTQCALKYVYEHSDKYDVICWVECATEQMVEKSCSDFIVRTDGISDDNAINRFVNWFQYRSNWLLIFDDVNENTNIELLIPKVGNGHIIITTQLSKESTVYGLKIEMESMNSNEAVEFLIKRTGINDEVGAKMVATRLGCLPLALEQAAAYMIESKKDFDRYFVLLQKYALDALDNVDVVANYRGKVTAVWNITVKRLTPAAKQTLFCFAYMSAENIKLNWLIEHAEKLKIEHETPDEYIEQIGADGIPTGNKININGVFRKFWIESFFNQNLIDMFTDELVLDRALMELRKFSLVTQKTDDSLKMHGLFQEVVRSEIKEADYLLSVFEVLKTRCNEVDVIYNDYRLAVSTETQAKSMLLNINALLEFKDNLAKIKSNATFD